MDNIDTYLLMVELKRRLNDHLYSEEPQHDSVLEDLWVESETNEFAMEGLHNQLSNLIMRFEKITTARLDDRDE